MMKELAVCPLQILGQKIEERVKFLGNAERFRALALRKLVTVGRACVWIMVLFPFPLRRRRLLWSM